MRGRGKQAMARSSWAKLALRLSAAGLVCTVTGCLQIEGLFGPVPTEQIQLQILRGMQHALSPSYNQPLNWMLRGIDEVLSMGLPTFYGIDLAPYLATVPWPPAPQRDPNLAAPIYGDNQPQAAQESNGEIYELQSGDQRELLQFLFNPQAMASNPNQLPCMPPSCKTLTYDVNLLRSVVGLTGSLQVSTSTRTTWSKMSAPAPHQPYSFGDLWKTTQPDNVSATATLDYEGQTGTISLSLTRAQTPSNDPNIQLQQIQINVDLPRISANLSGRVSAGSLAFSDGTIDLTDDQGNSQELQVSMFNLENGTGEATLIGQQQMLEVTLSFANGQLTGEVDSTNPNLSRELATINSQNNQTTVTYRDRGIPEAWN